MKQYHIFISHAWDYSDHYKKIKEWLSSSSYRFCWADYSVPISNPLDVRNQDELKERLDNRIARCSCIVIPSGMYVNHSIWIDYEINTAVAYGKPIIAIKPWGQQRTPQKIYENATVIIGWNEASVIEAIRRYSL